MAPEYACAIVEDAAGRLLLELRPPDAKRAPGQLTCFGGRREEGEDARACLARELVEELAWHPAIGEPACDLILPTAADPPAAAIAIAPVEPGPAGCHRWIARFFRVGWDGGPLRPSPGHQAVWVPRPALAGMPVSPWHAQAVGIAQTLQPGL